MMMNTTLNTAL